MDKVPSNKKYTENHEWAELQADGSVRIGITYHAQHLLGDMVFVELPEVGAQLAAGSESAVVESVKSAADVYSPIAGEVTAINQEVVDEPALLNQVPYEGAWLWQMQAADASALDNLLDADQYSQLISDEAE